MKLFARFFLSLFLLQTLLAAPAQAGFAVFSASNLTPAPIQRVHAAINLGVTLIPGATIECKAVCNITNSNQFRGYATTNQPIELIVSPGTQSISADVVRTIYRNGGSIRVYDPATGRFTPWKKPR